MKAFAGGLARLGAVRQPSWGQRDPPKQRLETTGSVVHCRSQ